MDAAGGREGTAGFGDRAYALHDWVVLISAQRCQIQFELINRPVCLVITSAAAALDTDRSVYLHMISKGLRPSLPIRLHPGGRVVPSANVLPFHKQVPSMY